MDTQIGQYEILSELGAGGMGVVYRALDLELQREVALKRLRSEFAASPAVLERFRREAQLQGRLNHPNIAQLYSLVQIPDAFCIVMEFIEGVVLKNVIPLSWQQAVPILLQALDGLGYAHSRGVLHRDIKPENILIDLRGTVKVMDFGIAHAVGAQRLTREKALIGTIEYMPPERIQGGQVDNRSDIYSMGILLFEVLTGRLPYSTTSEYEVMKWHVESVPPPLSQFIQAPAALDEIVQKAAAKKPEDRYASCEDMAAALRVVCATAGLDTKAVPVFTPNSFLADRQSISAVEQRWETKPAAPTRLVDTGANGAGLSPEAMALDPPEQKFESLTGATGGGIPWKVIAGVVVVLVVVVFFWFLKGNSGDNVPPPHDNQSAHARQGLAAQGQQPPATGPSVPTSDPTQELVRSIESPETTPKPAEPRSEESRKRIHAAITEGDTLKKLGDYDGALTAYRTGLQEDPANAEVRERIRRAQNAKDAEATVSNH